MGGFPLVSPGPEIGSHPNHLERSYIMCAGCCGSPKSPKSKGLKHFHFAIKPADLASTVESNPWVNFVSKLGWKVVKSIHAPAGHYYNSNEIWDDHAVVLQKGDKYAIMQCIRRPIQGKNVMTGVKPVRLMAAKGRKNPAKTKALLQNADSSKIPWMLKATPAQQLAEVRKNLKGFEGLDKKAMEAMLTKITTRWGAGKQTTAVKIGVWAPNAEQAAKVLERKGWKFKKAA